MRCLRWQRRHFEDCIGDVIGFDIHLRGADRTSINDEVHRHVFYRFVAKIVDTRDELRRFLFSQDNGWNAESGNRHIARVLCPYINKGDGDTRAEFIRFNDVFPSLLLHIGHQINLFFSDEERLQNFIGCLQCIEIVSRFVCDFGTVNGGSDMRKLGTERCDDARFIRREDEARGIGGIQAL